MRTNEFERTFQLAQLQSQVERVTDHWTELVDFDSEELFFLTCIYRYPQIEIQELAKRLTLSITEVQQLAVTFLKRHWVTKSLDFQTSGKVQYTLTTLGQQNVEQVLNTVFQSFSRPMVQQLLKQINTLQQPSLTECWEETGCFRNDY